MNAFGWAALALGAYLVFRPKGRPRAVNMSNETPITPPGSPRDMRSVAAGVPIAPVRNVISTGVTQIALDRAVAVAPPVYESALLVLPAGQAAVRVQADEAQMNRVDGMEPFNPPGVKIAADPVEDQRFFNAPPSSAAVYTTDYTTNYEGSTAQSWAKGGVTTSVLPGDYTVKSGV